MTHVKEKSTSLSPIVKMIDYDRPSILYVFFFFVWARCGGSPAAAAAHIILAATGNAAKRM